MNRHIVIAAAFAASAALAPLTSPAAQPSVATGTVEHVSTENIKIKEHATGKTQSFLLLPHFKNVFSKDGKTTAQMSALTPGTPVTIYYDQKALGARHADRILIDGSAKAMKS